MSRDTVPAASYLIVCNGRFYFDVRVPVDAAAAFGSKTIRFSLRTKERAATLRLMGKHLDHYRDRFSSYIDNRFSEGHRAASTGAF